MTDADEKQTLPEYLQRSHEVLLWKLDAVARSAQQTSQ
jgi:hypothetical protein